MDEQVKKLVTELERDEGIRLKPYTDTVGKLTIGVGRNLDDVGISSQEARVLLVSDIRRATLDLDRALPWWEEKLSPNRQRALINMCFNLGLGRLLGFQKMLKALEEGRWQDAHDEALDSKWAVQVGKRANRIAEMFKNG